MGFIPTLGGSLLLFNRRLTRINVNEPPGQITIEEKTWGRPLISRLPFDHFKHVLIHKRPGNGRGTLGPPFKSCKGLFDVLLVPDNNWPLLLTSFKSDEQLDSFMKQSDRVLPLNLLIQWGRNGEEWRRGSWNRAPNPTPPQIQVPSRLGGLTVSSKPRNKALTWSLGYGPIPLFMLAGVLSCALGIVQKTLFPLYQGTLFLTISYSFLLLFLSVSVFFALFTLFGKNRLDLYSDRMFYRRTIWGITLRQFLIPYDDLHTIYNSINSSMRHLTLLFKEGHDVLFGGKSSFSPEENNTDVLKTLVHWDRLFIPLDVRSLTVGERLLLEKLIREAVCNPPNQRLFSPLPAVKGSTPPPERPSKP